MEIVAANWEDWAFRIFGIVGMLGVLAGFLYSTVGRIYGFHKPFDWRGGGKSTFWGEMAVYVFILVWLLGFSGILGQAWIYFLPFAILSWIFGFIEQHRANKRARREGFEEEEDPIEKFGEELDRLENEERIAKGVDPIPAEDSAGAKTAAGDGRFDVWTQILKWVLLSPLILAGACIATFFLGPILGWDKSATDIPWMLMGIFVFVFLFLFFGIPGFFGVYIMIAATKNFISGKQKTKTALLSLMMGGAISVAFSYFAIMVAQLIHRASVEMLEHLSQ